VRLVSDRARALLVATALTVVVAAGLWMLGVGVDPHAVATADGGDRVLAHRVVPSAGKATPRLLIAAVGIGAALTPAAAFAPRRTTRPADAAYRTTRLYALLRVYRL
jgi:hypothetical protein